MRELKFRAWDIKRKRYVSDLTVIKVLPLLIDKEITEGLAEVEQYTGLKDKNGKEICEGDIVNYDDYENYAVEQSKSGAWTIGKTELFGLAPYCEVIGNIHENPELLEGE